MRLIDADELDKVKFHPLPYTHITPSDADAESYKRGWNDAIDAIMSEVPTIEERKKGKWLRYGEDGNPNTEDTVFWQCSECMETYTGRTTRIPNFCPNCGSEMR